MHAACTPSLSGYNPTLRPKVTWHACAHGSRLGPLSAERVRTPATTSPPLRTLAQAVLDENGDGRVEEHEILAAAIEHAKRNRLVTKGDSIVALHRIGNASVIKIVDIK